MNGRNFMVLAASVVLGLALVLTGCPGATPTPSTTPTGTPTASPTATPSGTPTASPTQTPGGGVELTYNTLNPRGIQPAVQVSPLSPRLDTFDGKVIYVNQGEADPIIMPAMWEMVQKEYPKTTWKYIATSSFGPSTVEADVRAVADAVIRGISW